MLPLHEQSNPNIRLTGITGCSEMIKIENLSAETTLDAAAREHIHGGGKGKFELKVWADPQERPSDRHTSDADSATMFVDVGAWAKA
jgi:hypothetical protein